MTFAILHVPHGSASNPRESRSNLSLADEALRDDLSALVLVEAGVSGIQRLDLCVVPSPHSARRTGDYPR